MRQKQWTRRDWYTRYFCDAYVNKFFLSLVCKIEHARSLDHIGSWPPLYRLRPSSAGRWQMVSMLYIADKRPNTLSAKDVFDDGRVLHKPARWVGIVVGYLWSRMMSIDFEYSMFNDIYGHVWPLLFMAMCCAGITIYGHVFLHIYGHLKHFFFMIFMPMNLMIWWFVIFNGM